jgi:catechol 2,3-dioxygenase-like lactoylglutathione lyase family enzyme
MVDFKLEVVTLPVADVDRAKDFYKSLGWREDADITISENSRVVQLTPPGSQASIQFGLGLTTAEPGSVDRMYLVVDDMEEARADLIGHGVNVSEVFHREPGNAQAPGPDPQHTTYNSFATFEDPDGNGWLLQEITTRLPGR